MLGWRTLPATGHKPWVLEPNKFDHPSGERRPDGWYEMYGTVVHYDFTDLHGRPWRRFVSG